MKRSFSVVGGGSPDAGGRDTKVMPETDAPHLRQVVAPSAAAQSVPDVDEDDAEDVVDVISDSSDDDIGGGGAAAGAGAGAGAGADSPRDDHHQSRLRQQRLTKFVLRKVDASTPAHSSSSRPKPRKRARQMALTSFVRVSRVVAGVPFVPLSRPPPSLVAGLFRRSMGVPSNVQAIINARVRRHVLSNLSIKSVSPVTLAPRAAVTGRATSVQFDADGVLLAVGYQNGTVGVYDMDEFRAHHRSCGSGAGAGSGPDVYRFVRPPALTIHSGGGLGVTSVHWNPRNLNRVACTTVSSAAVSILDLRRADRTPLAYLRLPQKMRGPARAPPFTDVAYSHDGRSVIVGDVRGGVRQWDPRASVSQPVWEMQHLDRDGLADPTPAPVRRALPALHRVAPEDGDGRPSLTGSSPTVHAVLPLQQDPLLAVAYGTGLVRVFDTRKMHVRAFQSARAPTCVASRFVSDRYPTIALTQHPVLADTVVASSSQGTTTLLRVPSATPVCEWGAGETRLAAVRASCAVPFVNAVAVSTLQGSGVPEVFLLPSDADTPIQHVPVATPVTSLCGHPTAPLLALGTDAGVSMLHVRQN